MRESHQGRSIVTLDRAQLVGLGFFAVLSGGLMFGLGYSAGKTRGVRIVEDTPKAPTSTLAAIDRKAELHAEIKQDADLTFYKTLVEKEEKQRAPKADAQKIEPARLEPKPDAVKVEAPKPEPVIAKVETVEKAEAPAPVEDEAELTNAVSQPMKEPSVPVVKAPAMPAVKEVKETKGAPYTIQVSAFRTEGEAESYVKLLAAKGFNAHVKTGMVEGKGTFYKVRVGSFTTKNAAETYKDKIVRENLPAWIVKAD